MGRKPKYTTENELNEIMNKLNKAQQEVDKLTKQKAELERKILEKQFENFSRFLASNNLTFEQAHNIILQAINTNLTNNNSSESK